MLSLRHVALVIAFSLLCGCGNDSQDDNGIVARVGSDVITADEFRLSYSLGFPHLTRGDGTPRESYLERMIDERLLALEGFRLGLDQSTDVQRQIASMRAELLVESVFDREVNDKVSVSDDEVIEVMAKESVGFKLRYLPAATREAAMELRALALSRGFEAAAERVATSESGRGVVDFESPYLSANEIDPTLLDAIEDLPTGRLSFPISFRGAFVVIEVIDIRRGNVDAVDPAARARMEQVHFQKEAKRLSREFVSGTMAPIDLKLKADTYRRLRRHLWDWYRTTAPHRNLVDALEHTSGVSADSLRALFSRTIMTTRDEEWSVERFLSEFPSDRYPLSTENARAFESDLYDAFGLTLRDREFVKRAERLQLDALPQFRDDMKRWTSKYVYRATLDAIQDTVFVSDSEARDYFDRHRDHYGVSAEFEAIRERVASDARRARVHTLLPGYLKELRARYPVAIYRSRLQAVDADDPKGPSSPALTVMKGHTGRPAFPIVDPHW